MKIQRGAETEQASKAEVATMKMKERCSFLLDQKESWKSRRYAEKRVS